MSDAFMKQMDEHIAAAVATVKCPACWAPLGSPCVGSRYAIHTSRSVALDLAGAPVDPFFLANIAELFDCPLARR